MRSTTIKLLGIFAIGSAMLFNGCTDLCKDVDCGANGTCDTETGTCVCTSGYEGTNCETRMTTKFVGNFNLTEVCTTGSDAYQCNVVESSGEITTIVFSNLYNSSISVNATVDANGTDFTIASQAFGSATISGSGSINAAGTQITVSYTVVAGGVSDACSATLARI
jgi:EGF-like domain